MNIHLLSQGNLGQWHCKKTRYRKKRRKKGGNAKGKRGNMKSKQN
jgi:hypothetical protein